MKAEGLEGIVVADTRLSDVDGEKGELIIAGSRVEQLSGVVSFEEVSARLWSTNADAVRRALGQARAAAWALMPQLGSALDAQDGMDALRAAIAHLPSQSTTREQLVGAMAVFAAAWSRKRGGQPPIAPDPD